VARRSSSQNRNGMARIVEVREWLSLIRAIHSKPLMAELAAIAVVGGGVVGLVLAGDQHAFSPPVPVLL